MSNKTLRTIGLMSGTSLDGIDAAIIETNGESIDSIGANFSLEYSKQLRTKIKNLIAGGGDKIAVSEEITLEHAKAVKKLLVKAKLKSEDIDLIGFHGQTIFHDPQNGKTTQIGDGKLLADLTKISVINDFRTNDVKNGGQGAPLAPLYHAALVKNEKLPVAIINIGGVGNITWVGANNDELLAFDTGPGNAMIDDWVLKHTGNSYDNNGEIASKGNVNQQMLEYFLEDSYFDLKPPKSLDRNHFDCSNVDKLSLEEGTATLTAFTIYSIAKATSHLPSPPNKYYITGGGRHNSHIMNGLSKILKAPVLAIEEINANGDMLEAEAFGFLAARSFYGLPLSLPSTTGVKNPVTGGVLLRAG